MASDETTMMHLTFIVAALEEAGRFFLHRDEMNAAVHCATVRLSPITEKVGDALQRAAFLLAEYPRA